MKKAAIIIDSWKLNIFKRHLDKEGFKYKQYPGITNNTISLNIEIEAKDLNRLALTTKLANNESARFKKKGNYN